MECIRQFLTTGKRPVSRVCPSCRQPFEFPIPLFLDLNEQIKEPHDSDFIIQDGPIIIQEVASAASDFEEDILPDITYYEENMASIQHTNDLLTAKLSDMERIILLYQRRCEAHEEAKIELKRQIDELGSWLERSRRSDAEKNAALLELEESLCVCNNAMKELEEERDTLAAENQHYQTLRVTDEYILF